MPSPIQAVITLSGGQNIACTTFAWASGTGYAQLSVVADPVTGTAATVDSTGLYVNVNAPLPSGGNLIGSVNVNALPSLPAGVNAIGSVTVSSLPALPAGSNAIGSVTVTSLPALPTGSNTIGTVNIGTMPSVTISGWQGNGVNSSGTGQFQVQADSFAQVNCGVASTQTVVAGVTGKKIFVTHLNFIAGGTGTVQVAYGPTPTAISGAYSVTAQTGISCGTGVGAIFIVPSGQDLKVVTTGTSATAQGILSYYQA